MALLTLARPAPWRRTDSSRHLPRPNPPAGDRSGHEEALGQKPGVRPVFLGQATLPDVLGQQGRHAGHLGRGHRCAGHALIGGPAGNQTIDRVNVAPWSSDLRLHLQGAGTPQLEKSLMV